jgi:hypothetical protein
VNGIGGKQLVAMQTGYLDEFFRVHASEQAKPNVSSLANVEDVYEVTYIPGQAFVVHFYLVTSWNSSIKESYT